MLAQLPYATPLERLLTTSPRVLEGYQGLESSLARCSLRGKLREQIALLVAAKNGCGYCSRAHARIAARMGLDENAIRASRHGLADDPKAQAALSFAAALIDGRGHIDDDMIAALRATEWSDSEITEIVAHVGLNVLRNSLALAGRLDGGE